MNRDDILADLARYRKPAVLDTHQTGLLAATDNKIAEHVDTCQDLAIKSLRRVRIGEPMIAEYVLPVITDLTVTHKFFAVYVGGGSKRYSSLQVRQKVRKCWKYPLAVATFAIRRSLREVHQIYVPRTHRVW